MAPSKLQQAIGAVKDQTTISLAKVGSNHDKELHIAIVKATRHEESPPDERYIREIISLTSYQRAYVNACVNMIAKRLNKTHNWVVALKSLMLIHRLLTEGDIAFEQEIFYANRRGTRLLNMSDFRASNSWDYSAFVRTYALYLDEQLEFKMQGRKGKKRDGKRSLGEEEEGRIVVGLTAGNATPALKADTPAREMKNELIFTRVHHFMQLLERFLANRPTGVAKLNRVIAVALYPVLKESFQLCYDITEIMGVLIDRFMQLEIPDMIKVHEIFTRVSKQYDELDEFYSWCKTVGIARSSEYPDVEKIPQKKLDMMDEYIHEKAVMLHKKRARSTELKAEVVEEVKNAYEPEVDMNSIKALPPPEGFVQEETIKDEQNEKSKVETRKNQEIGDLLDLTEDIPSSKDHGDKLALALFDGLLSPAPKTTVSAWESLKDSSSGDWETTLVQSASHLSNQQPSGKFDAIALNGMYQTPHTSGYVTTGSASSVVMGSTGWPTVLALPGPPGGWPTRTDPFAASIGIAPPAYVQMSEMEKKQRLLVQEQMMWQQYETNGMQGQAAYANVHQQSSYSYNMGGYMRTY